MGRILYKDIELDEANKEVHFSHSQFTERDINTDWMESLLSIDKNSLSHAQFGDISRLNSVANLDYQVWSRRTCRACEIATGSNRKGGDSSW